MRIAGVIAEYNPFHNGHLLHLRRTRQEGASHIVAVMSGSFVQRGEPALLDRWTRTRAALLGGADLVIELPVPFAAATAERFAFGAVSLLDRLGCVDLLSFGCEAGPAGLQELERLAQTLDSPAFSDLLKQHLEAGQPFAAARQKALETLLDMPEQLIGLPNNILAIEYLRMLRRCGSPIKALAVEREGAGHDAAQPEGSVASASYLRRLLCEGRFRQAQEYLPPFMSELIEGLVEQGRSMVSIDSMEQSILYRMRSLSAQELRELPDLSEGLENRIESACRQAVSLEELYALAKSKRYSHARIRRIVLAAFLGIPADLCRQPPPYLRILGFNQRGREILALARNCARAPLSDSLAKLRGVNRLSERFAQLEGRATDLYSLYTGKPERCGADFIRRAIRLDG